MAKRSWCLTVIWAAAAANAEVDMVKLEPTTLEMPRRIGPMQLTGEPHRYEPAALGVSYQYSGIGLSLTVYVYDAGITDIPDGVDTVPSCLLFEEAKNEVSHAGYSNVVLKSEQLVRLAPPDDAPLAREAVLEYVRSGNQTVSYLWITAVEKNFVKLRFSLDPNLADEVPEARRAVLDALGAAVKPRLQPVDPEKKKAGHSINIVMGGKSEDVGSSFMYQLLMNGIAEKVPEQLPVCGGPLEPSFSMEVAVLTSMAGMTKDNSASKFDQQLAAAGQAGFVDELVWTEFHRDAWGKTAPDDLQLTEYTAWKKKHLKRFRRPYLGEVVINHPRPMPVEPVGAPSAPL